MAITARNNLSPESQQWGQQITSAAQNAETRAQQALNQVNANSAALAGLANAVGNLNVKVVPLYQTREGSSSNVVDVPFDWDENYDRVVVAMTGVIEWDSTSSFSSPEFPWISVQPTNSGSTIYTEFYTPRSAYYGGYGNISASVSLTFGVDDLAPTFKPGFRFTHKGISTFLNYISYITVYGSVTYIKDPAA